MKKAPTSTRLKFWLASYRENVRSRSTPSSVRLSPRRENSPFAFRVISLAVFPRVDRLEENSIDPSATFFGDRALKNSSIRNLDRE